MTSRGNSLRACIFFICIFVLASGCDQYTKKKVLVFIFPPLAKEKKAVTAKEDMDKTSPNLKKKVPPQSTFFAHGPKAQGQCHQCHEASGSYSFRKADKTGAGDLSAGEGGVSGRLVMPVSELCSDCHTSKSQKAAYADGLWLHGPVAQGECTLCHQPHQSEFQYMLLKKNSVELCGECHANGNMKESEQHKTGAECILCHNPHAGKDNLLLKQDYNELF